MFFIIMKDGKRVSHEVRLVAGQPFNPNFVRLKDLPPDAAGIEILPDYAPELLGITTGVDDSCGEIELWLLPGFEIVNKIPVIKEIREVTGFGLKDSKDLADGAYNGTPKVLLRASSRAEACIIRSKFQRCGACIEFRERLQESQGGGDDSYHGFTT